VGRTGVGRRRLFWGRDKSSELSSCLCEDVMGVHGISSCHVSHWCFRQTQTSRRESPKTHSHFAKAGSGFLNGRLT